MVALGVAASGLEAIAVSAISSLLYLSTGGVAPERSASLLGQTIRVDLHGLYESHFWLVCAAVAAVVLLRTVAVATYGVVASSLKSLVFHRLRTRLYQSFMFAPYESSSQANLGFVANTLQVEAPRVAELIDQLFRIPINACGAVIIFGVLIAISWPVACLIVLCWIALAVSMQFARAYLHRLGQRILTQNEELASRMLSSIHAIRTIRAFAAEERESDRFADASKLASRTAVRFAGAEYIVTSTASLASLAIIAFVILFSAALGNSAVATLTVVALLFRLQPQFQALQSSITSIHGLESSLSLIVHIITANRPEQPPAKVGAAAYVQWDAIRFRDVCYHHPTMAEPTLDRLTFEIPRGQVTAIVGQSGAGKTTILNLLLRLTEPSSGVIEVGDAPLSAIDRRAWLSQLAITGQDIDVLNGTVLENLRLGAPDLTREDAMEALALAGIGDFIQGLPEGVETSVGERGYRLSGGQRQRIALARAVAKRPQLLILDEATNAVDVKLEATILERVRAAFPGLTILIVAHRGGGVSEADVVIDVANGRVRSISKSRRIVNA
jgi:ABC-type multidrug transport system fused ATPase/permease subunit